MKTKKYSLLDKGNLLASPITAVDGRKVTSRLRVASVPPSVASRKKWAALLATLSHGTARHNTIGWSGVVTVYHATELASIGITHNPWGYVEVAQ